MTGAGRRSTLYRVGGFRRIALIESKNNRAAQPSSDAEKEQGEIVRCVHTKGSSGRM